MDTSFLIYLVVGVVVIFFMWQLLGSKKRPRERPDDALLKLVADWKISGKVSKESEVKWIKFQGDTKVFRKRRYRIRGIIPDTRCFVFVIKTSWLSRSRVVLIPDQLCTYLNTAEISIRARGIQRWNQLIWFVVVGEKDQDNVKHFEDIAQSYLRFSILTMAKIEHQNLSFGAWYEAARGTEYQDFIKRTERLPAAPAEEGPPPVEEGV